MDLLSGSTSHAVSPVALHMLPGPRACGGRPATAVKRPKRLSGFRRMVYHPVRGVTLALKKWGYLL